MTYALLDGASGTRFYTGTAGGLDLEDIHFPGASEQFRLSVDTREGVPSGVEQARIRCSVLAVEESTDIGGYERAGDANTCTVLGSDSNGFQVELAVSSPFEETTDLQIWWALRAPGPVRFDTGTAIVDLVGAGEAIRISENSMTGPLPGWIGDGEVTCVVVGFWDR